MFFLEKVDQIGIKIASLKESFNAFRKTTLDLSLNMAGDISNLSKMMKSVLEKYDANQTNIDPKLTCLTIENLCDTFEITLPCSTMEEFQNLEQLLNANPDLFANGVTIY